MRAGDLEICRAAIRVGSYSFYTASKLLPQSVRDPALVLYAFCRIADDAVDEGHDKVQAVLRLRDRLDQVYAGYPRNDPIDRAFAAVVDQFEMPRALPEALLEGLAWDGLERRYQSLSDVRSYSARVASAVGAMMCVLMGVRREDALARACDLGVAMQLTNIARDVGEDARASRLYLPLDWFSERGLRPEDWLADPKAIPEIRDMVQRLLAEADRLYRRSEAGIQNLPLRVRPGIYTARYVYAAIGHRVRDHRYDSISHRAFTTKAQKLRLVGRAMVSTGLTVVSPQAAQLHAPALDEVAFLVSATARPVRKSLLQRRSDALLGALTQLEMIDRGRNLA